MYSEHRLGTTVDLDLNSLGSKKKVTVEWLNENAWKYGFINTVEAEPWHWRYVGKKTAEEIGERLKYNFTKPYKVKKTFEDLQKELFEKDPNLEIKLSKARTPGKPAKKAARARIPGKDDKGG